MVAGFGEALGAGGISHIFISYNRDDWAFAAVLIQKLKEAGLKTWLDTERLAPGVDWSEEIDEGIRTASALVLVMSPSSRASEYVTYEWSCAIGSEVGVVPILLRETTIHPRLSRLQYLDFRATDPQVHPWNKLIQKLQSVAGESQPHWKPPRDAPPYIHRAVIDLDSGNSADRHGAIDAIAGWVNSEAPRALQHALTSPFADVRTCAAITLAEKDDPAASTETCMRALTAGLRREFEGPQPSEATRRANQLARRASVAIVRLGRAALVHLTQVARSQTDPARLYAAGLLGEVGGTEAIPALLDLVESSDEDLAEVAIRQLGELEVADAGPAIVRRMIDSATKHHERADVYADSSEVARAAVKALVEIGDKSIEPQLVAAAKHAVPMVRMCAAEALGKLCGATAIPVLSDLVSDDDEAPYMYSHDDGGASGGRLTVGLDLPGQRRIFSTSD